MWWNGAPHCELVGKSVETETTTRSEFSNGGKAIVEQILASKEINKSRRAVWLFPVHKELQTAIYTRLIAYFSWTYTTCYSKIYYSIKSKYWNENK